MESPVRRGRRGTPRARLLARRRAPVRVATRDPELFGTGAVDENGNPLEVVLLKPGATITGRVVDAIDDCLASYLECSEEGIDFSWSGYPPLPNAFVIESTPRPDPHLPLRYFGHPIFWLPPDVLRPLPDEPLSIYTVRICMELDWLVGR